MKAQVSMYLLGIVLWTASTAVAQAPRASFAIHGTGKTEYTSTEQRYALSTARAAANNDCYDQKRKMTSRLGTSLKLEEQEQVSERVWQSGNGWHAEVKVKFIVSYAQEQAKAELPGANEEEPISVLGVEVKPLNDLNRATKELTSDTSGDFDWSHVESARNNMANSSSKNTSGGNPFVQHQHDALPAQRQAEAERKRQVQQLAKQRAEAEREAQTVMKRRIRLHQEEEAAEEEQRKIAKEEREWEYQQRQKEWRARQQQNNANRQAQMQMWQQAAQAMQTQPSYSPSTYSTPAAPVPTYFQPAPATTSSKRGSPPKFGSMPEHYNHADVAKETMRRSRIRDEYYGGTPTKSQGGSDLVDDGAKARLR